jgi:hypothetical protein
VIATFDAECWTLFDRKITKWATDFMPKSHAAGTPSKRLGHSRKEVDSPITAHDELPRSHHALEQAAG